MILIEILMIVSRRKLIPCFFKTAYVSPLKDLPPEEILELAYKDNADDTDAEILDEGLNWGGYEPQVEVVDPGPDVVNAYQQNLEGLLEEFIPDSETSSSGSEGDVSGRTSGGGACEAQRKSCANLKSFSAREVCQIVCFTKDDDMLTDLSIILQKSMKYFCRTSHTFFTRMDEFKIKNHEVFKSLLDTVVPRSITTNQVFLRAMLVKLMRKIKSPMTRLGPMFDLFDELLNSTHKQIGLKDSVLIGNHPGCAMGKTWNFYIFLFLRINFLKLFPFMCS